MNRKARRHLGENAEVRARAAAMIMVDQSLGVEFYLNWLDRAAPVQLRNEISFNNNIDDIDEINNEGDRSSSESDEDENKTSTPTSILAPGIGKQIRAFAGILGMHQGITNVAWKIVEQYTLYKKLLLIPGKSTNRKSISGEGAGS
ncbi:hypothetical protein BGX38DRAFT_1147407 [Terfezia claveryi]|nr:hypothetical protein BGX38DRAFT_1147407 [Terfezia claveryi]